MKKLTISICLATSLFAASEYEATLAGHAIMDANTIINAPKDAPELLKTNGKFETNPRNDKPYSVIGKSNGRPTNHMYPFIGQPIQGHSGIISLGDDKFAILTDNGLGSKANSKDSMLFYNYYTIDFNSGKFEDRKTIFLKDPFKIAPFAIVTEASDTRYLTGGDFDIESIQIANDFVYLGDEFGPYILKTDKNGNLLNVFETVVDGKVVKSPDNATLKLPSAPNVKVDFAVKRSKGFEGMAKSKDNKFLYPLLEGALYTNGKKENVNGKDYLRILEFSLENDSFTNKSWKYILESNNHSIGDFNMIDENYGLIIERDDTEGTQDKACKSDDDTTKCFANPANFKRIYKIKLNNDTKIAEKIAYIDLMNIKDPNNISKKPLVDNKFVFPFFTIENVDVVDSSHIIVGNDNNYPKSSSRYPNLADDNEMILLEVKDFLEAK